MAKSFVNIDNFVDLRKIKIEFRINKKYPIYYQYRITEIVAKKYQIIKIIGKGKFGIVFKVYNFIDKKNYALKMVKIYNSSTARSAVYENQMYRQINKLFPCNNNVLVKLYDSFLMLKNNQLYAGYVFELLDKSLSSFLNFNKNLGISIDKLQIIARQIFEGTSKLHEKGIVHSDLNLENICLINSESEIIKNINNIPINISERKDIFSTNNNSILQQKFTNKKKSFYYNIKYNTLKYPNIKLIDFGASIFGNNIGKKIVQKREYRAPEVILNCCEWNNKIDIWSIACLSSLFSLIFL